MLLFKSFLALTLTFTGILGAQAVAPFPPFHEDDSGGTSPMFSESRANSMAWLTLMDQIQYAATWDESGPLMKDVITRKEWIAAMETLRRPLGYVASRQIVSQRSLDNLRFGTKGYFMEINYSTTFWGKGGATETVILMYDVFSNWRVISYSVH